jgi:hypothetical protein
MKTSETITKITTALILAGDKIKHAIKDAQNNHMKNTYATLGSVIDAVKDELLKVDVVIIQSPDSKSLVTRLQHVSGEYIENTMDLILTKNDMQGLGSAITYARRYSLAAMLNIAQEDDDGTLASKSKAPSRILTKATQPTATKKDSHDF